MKRLLRSSVVRVGVALPLSAVGVLAGIATPASADEPVVVPHVLGGNHIGTVGSVDCAALGEGYLEGRGDNRQEINAVADRSNNVPAVLVAKNTVSFVFLSRVVTSVDFVLLLTPGHSQVTVYCTSDKDQGWRVLGSRRNSRIGPNLEQRS